MLSGTDLRVVKTRAAIRGALVEIMSEKPISGITVTELCALARINRKTFYRHYSSVGVVFEELENELLNEFSENIRSKSLLNINAVMRGVGETAKLHRDFFSRTIRYNPQIFTDGRMKTALRRTIAASLRNLGTENDGRELDVVSEFVVSGVMAVYEQWFRSGCREDVELLVEASSKAAVNGLSAYIPDKRLLSGK